MSLFTDAQQDAESLDGLVNDNALIPTRRNGPKPSYQFLVDKWNAEFQAKIDLIQESSGFRVVGEFATGFSYERFNDVGIDSAGGSWVYIGAGAPVKVVTAGTDPSAFPLDYKQVTFSDHGTLSNLNDQGGHDEIYARSVNSLKSLVAYTPTLIDGQKFDVTGFYASTKVGGGLFVWEALRSKTEHNGGTVIAPEALTAWDGSEVDIETLLNWADTGSGCWVRVMLPATAKVEVSPEQFGAAFGYDSAPSINAALKLKTRVNFLGAEYLCGSTLKIYRGCFLAGIGSIDDISTRIKKMPNMNAPLIQTELAGGHGGGVATHYYNIENMIIDGNRDNQTVETDLVQFWGAFVGSTINNVRLSESYGCPISFRGGCDIKVGTLWIVGNTVTSGRGAIETNEELTGGSLAGLLYVEQLYVENTSNKVGGDPRNVKADRAPALKITRFVSCNINELHIEGASVPVSLTRNIAVNINKLSLAYSGTDIDKTFIQYADNQTKELRCGQFVSGSGLGDYGSGGYYVNFASGVVGDNLLPHYNYNTSGAGGEYTSARDLQYAPSRRRVFSGSVASQPVGTAQRCDQRLIKNDGVDHFYVARDNSNMLLGYSSDNSATNDYMRFFKSTGNSAKVEMLKPLVMHTKADAADVSVGSMYIRSAGSFGDIPTYQAKSGQNASACSIASTIIGGGTAPTQSADYVGQMFLQTSTPKRLYFAVAVGAGASDWFQIA